MSSNDDHRLLFILNYHCPFLLPSPFSEWLMRGDVTKCKPSSCRIGTLTSQYQPMCEFCGYDITEICEVESSYSYPALRVTANKSARRLNATVWYWNALAPDCQSSESNHLFCTSKRNVKPVVTRNSAMYEPYQNYFGKIICKYCTFKVLGSNGAGVMYFGAHLVTMCGCTLADFLMLWIVYMLPSDVQSIRKALLL